MELTIVTVILALIAPSTADQCNIPCNPVTITPCQGSLSYNYTGFPNFFNHTSQDEANSFAAFIPVITNLGCYSQSESFLCGLLVPECSVDIGLTLPSRTTCEQFLAGCSQHFIAFGFDIDIDCNMLPDPPSATCYSGFTPPPGTTSMQYTSRVSDGGLATTSSKGTSTDQCNIPCNPITITPCQGSLPYSYTGFPNLFNHTSQDEANSFAAFIPVITNLGCYSQSESFLCSLLVPECGVDIGLTLPSRTTCEQFLAGCSQHLIAFGFDTVDIDCNMLPDPPTATCYSGFTPPPAPRITSMQNTSRVSDDGLATTSSMGTSAGFSINHQQYSIIVLVIAPIWIKLSQVMWDL